MIEIHSPKLFLHRILSDSFTDCFGERMIIQKAAKTSSPMQGVVWLIWQTRIPRTAFFKGIKQNFWQFDNDPPLEEEKRVLVEAGIIYW